MNPSDLKSEKKGLAAVHVAVFFFGLAGLFGKLVALPAALIVLGRVAFASVFLAGALLANRQSIRLENRRDYGYMVLMGVILAVHWTTFFQSIQVSTVAVGLLTFSTFPVFVTFLEPWFFKERLRTADVMVAVVAFAGVALVIPRFEFANRVTQGVAWGIASGLTFAVLSLLNRKYARQYSSVAIAFYQDVVAAIVLLPLVFVYRPQWRLQDIFALAFLGVVCTGVAHSLFIKGMSFIKARVASVVACLEPVYGIVIAAFLLHEIPGPRVCVGGLIILAAATYVSVRPAEAPRNRKARTKQEDYKRRRI